MFGNAITDFDPKFGEYGYIIELDTTRSLVNSMKSIFAQYHTDPITELERLEHVTDQIDKTTLLSYLDDENCPPLAFNYSPGLLTIFIDGTIFPFGPITRLVLVYNRDAERCNADTDRIDCPDEKIEELKNYALEMAQQLLNKTITNPCGLQ